MILRNRSLVKLDEKENLKVLIDYIVDTMGGSSAKSTRIPTDREGSRSSNNELGTVREKNRPFFPFTRVL